MFRIILILPALILTGCGNNKEEKADVGYSDGYAVGYNTECKIRATLVEGDWDNPDYTKAYKMGEMEGIKNCRKDRAVE